METQLILTVGTNALPVWVAWHHLKDKLEQPITVRFVHTDDTRQVKDRLARKCTGADFGNHVSTSAGSPERVRYGITQRIVGCLPDDPTLLHVHYTGGTQAMGVETVAALEHGVSNSPHTLQTSYLDVHGGRGPRIRSRARHDLIGDTRQGITPDLNHIAYLNGFRIEEPNHPTDAELRAGKAYLKDYNTFAVRGTGTHIAGGETYEKGDLLEYGAYAAFKKALKAISAAHEDERRDNYALFCNVKVGQLGAAARDFELDVVAVLGYQIVVVSCGHRDGMKLKAMEAYHRARQLGGDEARVVMLCEEMDSFDMERKLQVDIGSQHLPIEVWDQSSWMSLSQRFEDYLRSNLRWD